MPRVKTYDTLKTELAVPSARMQRFGAGDVAAATGKMFNAAFAVGEELQKKADILSAEEAANAFEKAKNDLLFNPDNGFYSKQGKDAYNGTQSAIGSLEKLKTQFGEGLTDEARRAFDRVATNHINSATPSIMKHGMTGMQNWEIDTLEKQRANAADSVSLYFNDDKEMKVQLDTGMRSAREAAEMRGLNGEEAAKDWKSKAIAGAIDSALVGSNVGRARELIKEYEKEMTVVDRNRAKLALERRIKSLKAENEGNQATLMATNIVSESESWSDVMERINNHKNLQGNANADLRKKVMASASTLYNANKKAELERSNAASVKMDQMMIDQQTDLYGLMGNPEFDALYNQLTEDEKLLKEKEQLRMETAQGKAEAAALKVAQDNNDFFIQNVLSDEEVMQLDPAKMRGAEQLNNGQTEALMKRQEDIRQGRAGMNDENIRAVLNAYIKDNLKNKKESEKEAFRVAVRQSVNYARTVDKNLTLDEVQTLINPAIQDFVIKQRPWYMTDVDLSDLPAKDQVIFADALNRLTVAANKKGIPVPGAEQLAQSYYELVESGYPVTAENLFNFHEGTLKELLGIK